MSCQDKRRYDTLEAANHKLDRIDAERPRKPGRKLPIRAYRCPLCRGWHLTSQAKRTDRKKKV